MAPGDTSTNPSGGNTGIMVTRSGLIVAAVLTTMILGALAWGAWMAIQNDIHQAYIITGGAVIILGALTGLYVWLGRKQADAMLGLDDEETTAIGFSRRFRLMLTAISALILVSFFWGIIRAVQQDYELLSVFSGTAMGLVVFWIIIMIAYLAWSIYFYNINFGLPKADWEKTKKAVAQGQDGGVDDNGNPKIFSPRGIPVPLHNPFLRETMGLPPGTIRGILALTVTVGGLAMFIASLGMDSTLEASGFFIDNQEFFKTAFLMVIAFYFGTKSLEIMQRSDSKGAGSRAQNIHVDTTPSSNFGPATGNPSAAATRAPTNPATASANPSATQATLNSEFDDVGPET